MSFIGGELLRVFLRLYWGHLLFLFRYVLYFLRDLFPYYRLFLREFSSRFMFIVFSSAFTSSF